MSRGYSVPNCPWCGMASRVSPEHHHEWETVHMTCGSEIYPPRSTSPSEQSDACKRIAVLASELQAKTAELERVRSAGIRLLAGVEDYLSYTHSGDPWEEDARTRGEMDLDELRGTPIADIRAALASMETGRG